jgi:hypothetical protein
VMPISVYANVERTVDFGKQRATFVPVNCKNFRHSTASQQLSDRRHQDGGRKHHLANVILWPLLFFLLACWHLPSSSSLLVTPSARPDRMSKRQSPRR